MSHQPRVDEHLTAGNTFRAELYAAVCAELEAVALIADATADRLTRSGKMDEAMVAVSLAAQIRARKPQ